MRDKLELIGEHICTNCLYDGEKKEFKFTFDLKEIIFSDVDSLSFDQEEVLEHEKPGIVEVLENDIHLIINHQNEAGKVKVVRLKIKAKDVDIR